ncbi:MAG: hypothetical protein R2844_20875 [Caldilineales bacterium]
MLDFAGSTVVHLTGALIGLAGTLLMGPRKDKEFGNAHKQIRGHNIPLAALGTFVLWFGWFGFNPGSALGISDFQLVSMIVVNTDFAATTGAITAMFLAYLYTRKWDASMAFNGEAGRPGGDHGGLRLRHTLRLADHWRGRRRADVLRR